MRPVLVAAVLAATALLAAHAQETRSERDPTPASLEELRDAAARIVAATGVPGAGIALVRADGVEWEGGIGVADRDRRTPVTADTHFRAGSISKTFVAIALVQLSEDGLIDLDAPLADVAPEIAIENPWHDTDPVRVIHLLQHTAGFDDLHFNEIYRDGSPLPLEEVLERNPASRRVRWRPGTRMAYSNPGYLLAGYLLEKLTETSFDTYIRAEILQPLGMITSSFALTGEDERRLAMGYHDAFGPPVGYPDIYMRPAGALHTSAREMSRFIGMLLNWGELDDAFVIDPEYLGNMEQPRTTIAARAGLRHGYGSGIFWSLDLPYPMLGHDGGIDGFMASYGYSPSRDVGYALMLNSDSAGAAEALNRLRSLCVRYLKRDVAPPVAPVAVVPAETLDRYVGYYHDANPRMQIAWGAEWLLAGRTVVRDGTALFEQPYFGARERLVPVSDTLFRREGDVAASRVFALDDDRMVLAGTSLYAQRRPRSGIELVRVPVLASLIALASSLLAAPIWLLRARRARPHGFWTLKATLVLLPLALVVPAVLVGRADLAALGTMNAATTAFWLGPLALPILAALAVMLAAAAWRQDASRALLSYAALMVLAAFIVTLYLRASNLLGTRLWMY